MSSILLSLGILAISFILFRAGLECAVTTKRIAAHSRLNSYFFIAVGSLVATVIVELTIAIISSSAGIPQFALGSALGANAALLGVVLPLAVLTIGREITVDKSLFSRQALILMVGSVMVPFFLLYDGIVTRLDGMVLILLFFLFALYIFGKRYANEYGITHLMHHSRESHRSYMYSWLGLLLSLGVLLIGGVFLVQSALLLGNLLKVPHYLLAFFIVGPALVLPGLIVAILGARERSLTVLFGDVVGSIVANATLTLGIAALITPFTITSVVSLFSWSFVGVAILGMAFVFFAYTKRKIVAYEAFGLITLYALLFFVMSYV